MVHQKTDRQSGRRRAVAVGGSDFSLLSRKDWHGTITIEVLGRSLPSMIHETGAD
jgi:hypothetical protein